MTRTNPLGDGQSMVSATDGGVPISAPTTSGRLVIGDMSWEQKHSYQNDLHLQALGLRDQLEFVMKRLEAQKLAQKSEAQKPVYHQASNGLNPQSRSFKPTSAPAPVYRAHYASVIPASPPRPVHSGPDELCDFWKPFLGVFKPNLEASIKTEFDRLAETMDWAKHSDKRSKMRIACYKAEFELILPRDACYKLEAWQDLCLVLDIEALPTTITQCKKHIKKVHVNMIDLIDHYRNGKEVRIFKTAYKLMDYTIKKGKQIPKQAAKEDGFFRVLLKNKPKA